MAFVILYASSRLFRLINNKNVIYRRENGKKIN